MALIGYGQFTMVDTADRENIQGVIASRFRSIQKTLDVADDLIARFADFITTAKDEQLFRTSPYRFAEKYEAGAQESINLFLYATHAGILEFNWGTLCPSCGAFLSSKSGLRWLRSGEHCSLCALPFDSNKDEEIEVAFTVSPSVRKIRFHDLENLDFRKDGLYVFFSSNIALFPEVHTIIHSSFHSSYAIEAGESKDIELEMLDRHHVLMAPVTHSTGHVRLGEESDGHTAEFELLLDGQITPETIPLAKGPGMIRVHNRTKSRVILGLLKDDRIAPIPNDVRVYPIQPLFTTTPYLTGKQLVSNQVFRDLFHAESIPSGGGLEFKSLTFLFTDLKGSTAMYDRMGDFQAYALVNAHFALLRGIIAAQGGAVVKTMGDAIMATFAEAEMAVQAAKLMVKEIKNLGLGEELILKIGIHSGPTLAVAANNQLDYFGQTVNIANRIQAAAEPGEILISEAVCREPELRVMVEGACLGGVERADLKGVSEAVGFYRIR